MIEDACDEDESGLHHFGFTVSEELNLSIAGAIFETLRKGNGIGNTVQGGYGYDAGIFHTAVDKDVEHGR